MSNAFLDPISRKGLLALAISGVLFAAGCGGGGSPGTPAVATYAVSGAAVKGPVSGATVTAYDANGVEVASATTAADGSYTIDIPDGTALPVELVMNGGTDIVTGQALDMPLKSLINATGTGITANITPATTLITETVRASNGGSLSGASATAISQANATVGRMLGFGADATGTLDLMSAPLTASNTAAYLRAAEAAGETIRRLLASAGAGAQVGDVFQALAADMADGEMDGMSGTSAVTMPAGISLSPSAFAASFAVQSASVGVELLSGSLTVTPIGGTTIDAAAVSSSLASAITTVQPTVTGSTALASIPLSTSFQNQLVSSLTTAEAVDAALGGTSGDAYTALIASIGSIDTTSGTATGTITDTSLVNSVTSSATAASSSIATTTTDLGSTLLPTRLRLASNTVQVVDYVGSTATPFSATGSVSNGVMTLNLGTPLNAANLSALLANPTLTTVPAVRMALQSQLPIASGQAVVTASVTDGSNATRDAGERAISLSFTLNWSADGNQLVLSAPAGSSATATYYLRDSSTAVQRTISNAVTDTLTISPAGFGLPGALGLQIGAILQAVPELLSANPVGSYFYRVSISGMPLAGGSGNSFTSVQGTFQVQ